MYVYRDFQQYPVYFKVQLVKYEIKKNTFFQDPVSEANLKDYTVNTEDLFGEEREEQEIELTKPQQYTVTSQRRLEDPTRSYIDELLPIIEYDLNNNWTIVFNSYYDMDRMFIDNPDTVEVSPEPDDVERDAVRWKANPILLDGDERSFTCWFRMTNYLDRSKLVPKPAPKLPITIDNIANGEITYSTYPLPHKMYVKPNPEGYVSIIADGIRSGGFEILEIVDEFKFKVKDNGATFPISTAGWKAQKAQVRNLINGYYNGQGMKIDIIWSGSNNPDSPSDNKYIQTGSFRIRINDLEISSPFGAGIDSLLGNFIPYTDDWYSFVFNFSNVFKQYGLRVWRLTYDPENPAAQTSDLTLIHGQDGIITQTYTYNIEPEIETDYNSPYYGTNNKGYKITSSPIQITNFRMFTHMIEEEKQSTILNQNIVDDAQLAIIIDNAKPILKLPKVARNR